MSQGNSNTQAGFPIRTQFNKVNYNQLSQQATTHVSRDCHAALITGYVTVTPAVTVRFNQLTFHVENKGTNQCQTLQYAGLQEVTLVIHIFAK